MATGSSLQPPGVSAAALRPATHRPTSPQPTTAPQFLTTDEAAAVLRLSPRTLEKQRVLGGGPRFRKFGARVLYATEDLQAWADSRAYGMTSDPGCPQRASVR
ncbi:MAG: helix-turn-helix domain-containing protein [Burkholderiaceae bacterium]